ncbi:MAG: hypothetical protein AUG74_17180 [Bacteroidetes bacterium 13_1_20CM_4_60_6]|nr:MAG: hypothetical protein AUG74_17180 [Bacteroidetes bacterium 13_1_20CM_4_60_6]
MQRPVTGKIILRECPLRLVIGLEPARFEHEEAVLLGNHVCRRAAQCQRRFQMAVEVKHAEGVASGLPDEDSSIDGVGFQQRDDRAALHPRNERARGKRRGIELRLSRERLSRQRVGGMVEIIPGNLLPIWSRHRFGQDDHRRIAGHFGG